MFGGLIPPWMVAGAGVLVVVGSFGYGMYLGHKIAASAYHERELKAEIMALKRDAEAQKEANDIEAKMRLEAEAENDQIQKELDAYEELLKTRHENRCVLGPDDIDRLRKLGD